MSDWLGKIRESAGKLGLGQRLNGHWLLLLAGVIAAAAAVVVFLVAWPLSMVKVPSEFDERPFQSAAVYDGRPVEAVYLERVRAACLGSIQKGDYGQYERFWGLFAGSAGKVFVVEKLGLGEDPELKQAIRKKLETLEQNYRAVQQSGAYYENYEKLNRLRRDFDRLQNLQQVLGQMNLDPGEPWALAAIPAPVKWSAWGGLRFEEGTARPLTDLDLLEGVELSADARRRLEETAARQKEQLAEARGRAEEAYENEFLGPAREAYRRHIWGLWFTILALWTGVCLASWLAWLFLRGVRRVRIQPKSTEALYYATNRSQKILQVIALVLVYLIVGLVWLGFAGVLLLALLGTLSPAELLFLLSTESLVVLVPAALLPPVVAVALAIVHSWALLLASEFVWFLSNCYHLVHLKTYGEPEAADESELASE